MKPHPVLSFLKITETSSYLVNISFKFDLENDQLHGLAVLCFRKTAVVDGFDKSRASKPIHWLRNFSVVAGQVEKFYIERGPDDLPLS
jgi:hypothetical protein